MLRVLLVDDDLAAVSRVRRALDGAGLELVLAPSTAEAEALLAEGGLDVALVAAGCDRGEGATLARRLAADVRARTLPVVVLGGPAAAEGQVALPLPIDRAALTTAVRAAVARRAASDPPDHRALAEALRAQAERVRREVEAAPARGDLASPAPPTADQAEALRRRTREAARPDPGALQALARAVSEGAVADALRVAGAAEPAAQKPAAPDPERVRRRLELARKADYFEVLGVPHDCTGQDARVAAARLLVELDPERYPGLASEALAELAEIRGVVAEAREVLGDDRLRAEYRQALEA